MRSPQEIVLDRALGSWMTRVLDPAKGVETEDTKRGKVEIRRYIEEGLGWKLPNGYAGDGAFSWCGAFAAWCWLGAGLTVENARKFAPPDAPGHVYASTWRLSQAAKRDPAFKVAKVSDIRPGDTVVIEGPDHKPYGDHIVTALAWDKVQSELVIVHGNGHGRWPTGEWVEGVVVSTIPRSSIVAAYRPNERWLKKV